MWVGAPASKPARPKANQRRSLASQKAGTQSRQEFVDNYVHPGLNMNNMNKQRKTLNQIFKEMASRDDKGSRPVYQRNQPKYLHRYMDDGKAQAPFQNPSHPRPPTGESG